jgi:hypothetical protein
VKVEPVGFGNVSAAQHNKTMGLLSDFGLEVRNASQDGKIHALPDPLSSIEIKLLQLRSSLCSEKFNGAQMTCSAPFHETIHQYYLISAGLYATNLNFHRIS